MVRVQDEGMIMGAETMETEVINKLKGRTNQRWREPSVLD